MERFTERYMDFGSNLARNAPRAFHVEGAFQNELHTRSAAEDLTRSVSHVTFPFSSTSTKGRR